MNGIVRRLTCCVCGDDAGRYAQHPNRDTGYGICRKCVLWLVRRGTTQDELLNLYGREGISYESLGDSMICTPDCTRVDGFPPKRYCLDLFTAMGVLREELVSLEYDITTAESVVEDTAHRGHRLLAGMPQRWESQRQKIAQFFDIDVYLDRSPSQPEASAS